ncbi:unnamed protein product [Haemonchus placei]|uniref:MADF domain-containing protein n=1 Tax=Haemonchus placei TaxID=6290 RepID=A0A0N4WDJ7_HAEPC|nr:unnamed protein product [Haemonchus placei]
MSATPIGMDMDVWIAELISKVSGFIDEKGNFSSFMYKLRLRLIELVEKEECIWDRRNGDFKMRIPRDNAWRRITSIMREEGHNVTKTKGFMREEVADIDVVDTSMREDVNKEDKYEYVGKLVTSKLRDYDKNVNEEFAKNKMKAIFSIIMSRNWSYGPQDHCRSRDAPQECVPSPCRAGNLLPHKEKEVNGKDHFTEIVIERHNVEVILVKCNGQARPSLTTVSNIDEELGSHSSSSFSEYESSHSTRPQRKKRRYDDDSETLELIRRTTARVNETAAGLYAARATARKEDEYDQFGKWLACALRECPEDLKINKMEAINAVLFDKEPMFVDAVVNNLHSSLKDESSRWDLSTYASKYICNSNR